MTAVPDRRPSSSRLEFLGESDDLRRRLDAIDSLVDNMMEVAYQFQSVTTSAERKIAIATFEATVHDASNRLKDAKLVLDDMQRSNAEFQDKHGEERASEWSFRVSALSGHTKRLRGLFTRIASAQTMFDGEMQRRVGIQGVISPESTGDLPHTPMGSSSRIPAGVAKAFATASIDEQRLRQDDMRRVEKSLRELREAFLQIAALVDSQGEMLDCIEFSVINAKNYSHQANVQLIKARRKQRRVTWMKAACFICIIILLVALGIAIWKLVDK